MPPGGCASVRPMSSRTRVSSLSIALALSLLGACGDNGKDLATPQACNPLGGQSCMTPWPSALYQVDDATTLTGQRNAIPDGTLPINIDNIPVDPGVFNQL